MAQSEMNKGRELSPENQAILNFLFSPGNPHAAGRYTDGKLELGYMHGGNFVGVNTANKRDIQAARSEGFHYHVVPTTSGGFSGKELSVMGTLHELSLAIAKGNLVIANGNSYPGLVINTGNSEDASPKSMATIVNNNGDYEVVTIGLNPEPNKMAVERTGVGRLVAQYRKEFTDMTVGTPTYLNVTQLQLPVGV